MNAFAKTIIRASRISIAGNALLAALKISVGLISGSLAVIGDGIDSASDIITSLITLFTARIIARPPDKRYPYGYLKADTVATKALSFVIAFAGAQLAISTTGALIEGTPREMPGIIAIHVTIFSILAKFILARYLHSRGKKSMSEMLRANARNMQNDVLISLAVLVGLFFTFILEMPILDSVAALLVSAWILKVAFQIFMQTNRDLMDGVDDPGLYSTVIHAVEQVPGAHNPHRIRIRKIAKFYLVAIDLEVDGDQNVYKAHEIGQKVEYSIRKAIDNIYDVVIHIEPYGNIEKEEKYGITRDDLFTEEDRDCGS